MYLKKYILIIWFHLWIYADDRGFTHWDRVTHICVVKLTIIGSDNGLSPGRRQATIWTNFGILLIGPLGTNFSGILIGIQTFSFKKMHLKMSSAKWRIFCLGLNVLINPKVIWLLHWMRSISLINYYSCSIWNVISCSIFITPTYFVSIGEWNIESNVYQSFSVKVVHTTILFHVSKI